MAGVIVVFDMFHIDSRGDTGLLEKVADITRQVWIIDDAPDIAFEMPDINRIKPHQSCEQPPVSLGDAVTHQIALF